MANLAYSSDAINALSKFYRCDTIIYVEGDDDEIFWATVFQRCAEVKIVAQSLGGSSELDKFIERIVGEDLSVLAARDSDFVVTANRHFSDARIIYTFGYSIENTLYTEQAIAKLAQVWCKGKRGSGARDCSEWLAELNLHVEGLTAHDMANYFHDCGVSVTGDSFARFAKKGAPHEVDSQKISRHLAKVGEVISSDMLDTALAARRDGSPPMAAFLRGHFLASAVAQFLMHRIASAGLASKISYDGLFVSAIQILEVNLDENHPHFLHYREAAASALEAI